MSVVADQECGCLAVVDRQQSLKSVLRILALAAHACVWRSDLSIKEPSNEA